MFLLALFLLGVVAYWAAEERHASTEAASSRPTIDNSQES